MNAVELIRKKHAGGELSAAEIGWLVQGGLSGEIPDYQLSALLMAICYEHLSFEETVALTRALVESGKVIDLTGGAAIPGREQAGKNARPTGVFIDKHSTGGVGDKVSLMLLPLLASMGFKVAKMSGRGLGHTGGTIDKLESIPGFRTNLSRAEMLRVVDEVGCCIVEQSADLVPADKKFYALRDATDTVGELGLIAASVMSKKIACGAPLIVLDVKCGSGAFFKTLAEARDFAQLAKRIGEQFGRRVGCVISSMKQPLGQAVGNAIEVLEVIRYLQSADRVQVFPDLTQLIASLGNASLALQESMSNPSGSTGYYSKPELSLESLAEVEPLFRRWIAAQGGDLAEFVEQYADYFANNGIPVTATAEGYVQAISTDKLGATLATHGAGRSRAGEAIDPRVGLLSHARIGDRVSPGDKLATLYLGASKTDPADAARSIAAAYHLGPQQVRPESIILDKIF